MKTLIITLLLASLAIGYAPQGQTRPFTIANSNRIPIESEITGRAHELVVILPGSYQSETDKTYPVLYFLDAYWDAPLISGIHNNLAWDNLLPEMILVGLSYAGEDADYDDLRARDLTPTPAPGENPHAGQAPKFLQFLEEDVLPYVEANYRVSSERALSGNSLGGLFTLYAMYEKPGLFERFIAISPAVGWGDKYLFSRDAQRAEAKRPLPVRLYLSEGGDEYAPFRDPIVAFQKQLKKRGHQGMHLMNATIAGCRHTGVKAEAYTRGLQWVFDDMAPQGPSGLEKAMRGR